MEKAGWRWQNREGRIEKAEKGDRTEKADNEGRINEAGWRR